MAEEIEQYLKNKENAEAMKRDRLEAKMKGIDHIELDDDDYQNFQDALEADRLHDEELIYDEEDDG